MLTGVISNRLACGAVNWMYSLWDRKLVLAVLYDANSFKIGVYSGGILVINSIPITVEAGILELQFYCLLAIY